MSKRAVAIELPPKYVQRIDPTKPTAEQISSSLRNAILEMSLEPGQIISESEIGHLFGASRTPVREAFQWLRDHGLLVTYPSRGNFVSNLSIPQIKGAQFIRESLEVSCAVELCRIGIPRDTMEEIEANLAEQSAIVASGNRSLFHELDDNFHIALADAVGHPRIAQILQREKTGLDRLRVLSLNSPAHLKMLIDDHHHIFNAIRSGDTDAATDRVRIHLRRVLDTLSDLYEKHSEFFDNA